MKNKNLKYLIIALVVGSIGILVLQIAGPKRTTTGFVVAVTVPELSPQAARGKAAFDANCAACHGINAAGTGNGPPLVHNIYNPGHHADGSFFLAAKNGVRAHHWRYGDMPPQPQVTPDQMTTIVRYVRELQAANGIGNRPHRM